MYNVNKIWVLHCKGSLFLDIYFFKVKLKYNQDLGRLVAPDNETPHAEGQEKNQGLLSFRALQLINKESSTGNCTLWFRKHWKQVSLAFRKKEKENCGFRNEPYPPHVGSL